MGQDQKCSSSKLKGHYQKILKVQAKGARFKKLKGQDQKS